MENTPLRPRLPWRRVLPGTYAAETPTGHTYRVEKTDTDWRVILLGPRGGREVIGEPVRIKWIGQCRAENHYLHVLGAKTEAPKATLPPPEKVAAAAASLKAKPNAAAPKGAATKAAAPKAAPPKAAPGRKDNDAKPASRRHRRPPTPEAKPAPSGSPLPAETLAWKLSQKKGREFHVAEHEGGLFKILEVKGTEGFALFDEKTDGVVHEIRCGSLDACKQVAATMYETGGKRGAAGKADATKGDAAGKADTANKGDAAKAGDAKSGEGPKAKGKREPEKAAQETSAGQCGCQHAEEAQAPESAPPKPENRPAADDKTERQAKIMAGLVSGLRKIKPPTVEA